MAWLQLVCNICQRMSAKHGKRNPARTQQESSKDLTRIQQEPNKNPASHDWEIWTSTFSCCKLWFSCWDSAVLLSELRLFLFEVYLFSLLEIMVLLLGFLRRVWLSLWRSGSAGTSWNHHAPAGTSWYQLLPSGASWHQLVPAGISW